MSKWLRQNITAAVIIVLLAGYGGGAAIAGVVMSDVDRLKKQVENLPEWMGRMEERMKNMQEQNTRIEQKLGR